MNNLFRASILICFLITGRLTTAQEKTTFTLKQALEAAKNNNSDLKAGKIEVEYARSEIISAKTRPNLSFSTEIVQVTNPSDFEDPSGRYRGGNREELWELAKVIQTPAQRRHKIAHASRSLDYEQQQYFELENELLTEVALKWIETLSAKIRLEAFEHARKEMTHAFPATHQERGNVNRETLQAEFLKTQFNLQHRTAQLEMKNQLNELKLLLNLDFPIDVDTTDDIIVSIPENMPELMQIAVNNRNDMKAAQLFSDVSESNMLFQKAMAIPQPEFGLIYNPKNNVTHIGFSATIDLPFFDRNQAERQKAEIQKNHAQLEISSLEKKIANELSDAYDIYLLHRENLKDIQVLKEHSERFLKSAKDNFQKNETDFTEYVEEIEAWLEIQLQYVEIKEGFQENYVILLSKLGMLQNLSQ